jgi:transposase InsO family protein
VFAVTELRIDARQRGFHRRVIDARRVAALCNGGGVRGERIRNRVAASVERHREHLQFVELLQREREPRVDFRVELLFARQIDGYVQQRA